MVGPILSTAGFRMIFHDNSCSAVVVKRKGMELCPLDFSLSKKFVAKFSYKDTKFGSENPSLSVKTGVTPIQLILAGF